MNDLINDSLEQSVKHLRTADHLLTTTIKFVGDYKLLILVVQNLFLSLTKAINALLVYHYSKQNNKDKSDYNKIYYDITRMKFDEKKKLFIPLISKYHFDPEILSMVLELKNIIIKHEESPVVFTRNKRLIICDDHYNNTIVDQEFLERVINKTKIFIQGVITLVRE